ncbi:histidine kinase [Desulfobacterales bacterium HSG17]|nr:histidine kinase [Desulfobacterales bacterium HSG17]
MAEKPTYEELEKRIQKLKKSESEFQRAKKKLQTEEKELRSILNINPDLMIVLDAKGCYRDIFTGDPSKLILPVNQLLGKSIHEVMPPKEAQPIQDLIDQTLSTKKFQQKEYTLNIEGDKRWFIGRSIKIIFQNSECILWFARDITRQKQSDDLVKDLSQKLIQAQERERQMLSCELHDSIAQDLSTLKLYCSRLFDNKCSTESGAKGSPADVSKLIDQTITTVRDLAYTLRPPSLEHLGLVHALKTFCEEFSEKTNIIVDFQVAGINESILNSDIQINIYRLVTEGLSNVGKHAVASKTTIRLVGAHPNIILRIKDNGKGFDVKKREDSITNEKRMGLSSMKERVNLLHGHMSIHSQPNEGTQIVIELPLKDK